MQNCRLLFLMSGIGLILCGCWNATVEESSQNHEFVLVVCEALDPLQKATVLEVVGTILNGPSGDVLHVISSNKDGHERIASVVINGSRKSRARDPQLGREVKKIRDFLQAVPKRGRAQIHPELNLPILASDVRLYRQTGHPLKVLCVGSALYMAEDTWAMKDDLVPTGGALTAEDTPWSVLTHKLPESTDVAICCPRPETWAKAGAHANAVERFYANFLHESGAKLVAPIAQDTAAAFDALLRGNEITFQSLTMTGEARLVPAIRAETVPTEARPAPQPESRNQTADTVAQSSAVVVPDAVAAPPPDETKDAAEKALKDVPVDRIGIALVWQPKAAPAPGQQADLDLWIANRSFPNDVINYRRMSTSWGRLYRDVRHPLPASGDIKTQWEFAELQVENAETLCAWVNVYFSNGPVTGIVRVKYNNKIRDWTFPMEARGDGGKISANRQSDPNWLEIPLTNLLSDD